MVYLPVSECEHLNKLSSITIMGVFLPLFVWGWEGEMIPCQILPVPSFLTLANCDLPVLLFIYLEPPAAAPMSVSVSSPAPAVLW